jgi:competence protein ComEA
MATNAPWRALEVSDEAAAEASSGRSRPSTILLMLAAASVLVVGSLAAIAFVELKPGGQVEVVVGQNRTAGSGAPASQAMVVVQVAGAVARPGVYSLPTGSRVEDAISAAGGYSTDVDPRAAETKLNLAAKLQDAELIAVPRLGETSGTAPAEAATSGPINLNTATPEQLDALPGIGLATATKIIASRGEKPFASVDDLVTRKLVTAATLAKFRDQVTVG